MLAQARAFAGRIEAMSNEDSTRIQLAYQILFGRSQDKTEEKLALKFLSSKQSGEITRWEEYAQMLLASNEMIYVD